MKMGKTFSACGFDFRENYTKIFAKGSVLGTFVSMHKDNAKFIFVRSDL